MATVEDEAVERAAHVIFEDARANGAVGTRAYARLLARNALAAALTEDPS